MGFETPKLLTPEEIAEIKKSQSEQISNAKQGIEEQSKSPEISKRKKFENEFYRLDEEIDALPENEKAYFDSVLNFIATKELLDGQINDHDRAELINNHLNIIRKVALKHLSDLPDERQRYDKEQKLNELADQKFMNIALFHNYTDNGADFDSISKLYKGLAKSGRLKNYIEEFENK